jgi:flagellar assembly protein FliH
VRVHPEDEETMRELLETGKERHPGLERWTVRTDPSMQPGGLVLESDQGMVDNSLGGRREMVAHVLDQLALPAEHDDSAEEASAGPSSPGPSGESPGQSSEEPSGEAPDAAAPKGEDA